MIIHIRKKPIEVSAIQWKNNEAEIRDFVKDDRLLKFPDGEELKIWNSIEVCWVNCPMFHFLIKGIKGEFYPISPEILERTYDVIP